MHSDGSKEYIRLQKNISEDDTCTSFSAPYTPEHNGIAERVNRSIIEAARTLLIQANLPKCLWTFAVKHVVKIRNRIRHCYTRTTPYFLFTKRKPSLKNIRVFGCAAFVLREPRGSKFEPRAREGVYLKTL